MRAREETRMVDLENEFGAFEKKEIEARQELETDLGEKKIEIDEEKGIIKYRQDLENAELLQLNKDYPKYKFRPVGEEELQ